MVEDVRPNPDELLATIQSAEAKKTRGRMRLFFGMAAGVGKTFAMLRAAQEQLKAGVDVEVGVVETHGRADTAALLQGLPIISRKKIDYRGTILEEMDLDAILARHPQIVLVDELAHTNAPGSRHPKRYQDVLEILDAGIDVYSTMNVQHLESRVDVVQLITATNVRETVPDSILDLADPIELVDISPHELLKRFREGKVYSADKAQRATQHFFQESHLTALREIALRATAERVDQDLQEIMESGHIEGPWAAGERLMVAVSHSPHSERLIRATRRMAFNLEAPWIALYVDTGVQLSEEDQNRLVKNLNLARELGGEVVTTQDNDLAKAIERVAKSKNVIQIIMGRPERRLWRDLFFGGNLLQRIVRQVPDIDVHVLHQPPATGGRKIFFWPKAATVRQPLDYLKSLAIILAVSLASHYLSPFVGYRAVGFGFLLTVIVMGLFFSLGPVLLSATLSALIWDYFFIPPHGTLVIREPEDALMVVAYFLVALITGFLTLRIRRQQSSLRQREERTNTLYEILKAMTLARGVDAVVKVAIERIQSLFAGTCAILLAEGEDLEKTPRFGTLDLDEKDWAVATWSFQQGRIAGWSTETLPMARSMAISLKLGDRKLGVLLYRPASERRLTPEQQNLLFVIANQIAIALAKEQFEEDAGKAKLFQESEQLHQTLLNCISHELRTPLTAILGAATALQGQMGGQVPESQKLLAEEIVNSAERLNRVFENLLDMTRLESGLLTLNREWFDLSELVRFTARRLKKFFSKHTLVLELPDSPVLIEGDFHLLEHALSNLMINGVNYTPEGATVTVNVALNGDNVILSVSDQGPGVPPEFSAKIFEKFYRLPGAPSGGIGLGLAITKSLVELHGGKIEVESVAPHGAKFSITLTMKQVPAEISEVGA